MAKLRMAHASRLGQFKNGNYAFQNNFMISSLSTLHLFINYPKFAKKLFFKSTFFFNPLMKMLLFIKEMTNAFLNTDYFSNGFKGNSDKNKIKKDKIVQSLQVNRL